MASQEHIAHALAMAVTVGRLSEEEAVRRMANVLGKRWRWLRPLAQRVVRRFGSGVRPRQAVVKRWITEDAGFRRAVRKRNIQVAGDLICKPEMCAGNRAASGWSVPAITTVRELADWCDTPLDELAWLADRDERECATASKYRRYRYRVLCKGLRRFRLIEVPIYRLKTIQRRLLSEILHVIPPHDASHGFRPGRSIHSFAAAHTGRHVVLKMDLEDFFPTIGFGRVSSLFRLAGYPEGVADMLAGVTTNTVPEDVWPRADYPGRYLREMRIPSRYRRPHLPQGGPSSPALANLCAYKLDRRLSGLAAACGATYTRYADDLVFSGDDHFARCVSRLRHHIAAIVMDEGFQVNYRKTRVMRAATRQRITGLVVNQHCNIERRTYDRIKAILHNCLRHGLESQNQHEHADFRAHLTGRVAFVEAVNPTRGKRLREMLDRIE